MLALEFSITLGIPQDPFNRASFKSFRVSAKFVWLAFQTGALTDEESWKRSFADAHINYIRLLRNVEGPKSSNFSLIILLFLVIFLVGISFFLFFNATFTYRFDYWNTRYWVAFSLRMAFCGTSFPQIPLIDFSDAVFYLGIFIKRGP